VYVPEGGDEILLLIWGKKRHQGLNRHIVAFGDVPERHTVSDLDRLLLFERADVDQ
jgi:hypothetical protein